jgi:hypothetical protein
MLSGSATRDLILLHALTPVAGMPSLNAWESRLVPVPEPGVPALLGLGLPAALAWRLARLRHRHAGA